MYRSGGIEQGDNKESMMLGNMMNRQLMISTIIRHAARYHGTQTVVSRTVEGPIHRYTYADLHRRTKQLAHLLHALDVQPGDRVATLAWNTHRHLELYYGVSGMGAVCHTVNPRLFRDQLIYIFNHAADKLVFVDLNLVAILEDIAPELKTVLGYVIMTDKEHMPDTRLPNVHCYEELLAAQTDEYQWPELDEYTASMLCYTSGTTGNPKGSLYNHRSTLIHALSVNSSMGELATTQSRSFLVIVPMFHVAAWGNPYMVVMNGGKLVLPGPRYDGESLFELMDEECVTSTAGVPTIVATLLAEMQKRGRKPKGFRNLLCGGAAPSSTLIEAFEKEFDVRFTQGWGMTETSPVGSLNVPTPAMQNLSGDDWLKAKLKQGKPCFGVDVKIIDDDGNSLPHDGNTTGELAVSGAFIIGSYFEDPHASELAFDEDGWFKTGDVCSIDPEGYLHITDRSKDLIKSGGEWISSIDLENAVMGHPAVIEAAAIAIPHPKWQERPLLLVVKDDSEPVDKEQLNEFLSAQVSKWWLPDDILFVDELPHGATGKVSKKTLREQFRDYVLPTV